MDYDADGTLDFVSGSYDPGDIYLFKGLGGGKYAAGTPILDETGTPLVHHPEELKKYKRLQAKWFTDSGEKTTARVASFGSWPAPVDWDGDGDLDMLIGSFSGEVYLRRNKGARAAPVFDAASVQVFDGNGSPLSVSGHADPFVADWDGDGRFDLVIGSADGSVGWHRNVGSELEPKFAARQELVPPKSDTKFFTQYLEPDEEPSPGARAQICIADYDGDGLLDLLVGDYSHVEPLRDLGPKARAAFDRLLRADREMLSRLDKLDLTGEERERLAAERAAIEESMKPFLGKRTDDDAPRSFVWLFRRRPAEE